MSLISKNLKSIIERISSASSRKNGVDILPRLVAVSKFKSEDDIVEAYKAGQRNFGENYVQELEQKSKSIKIQKDCPDIRWHFIGNLQTKKCNKIASLPNMYLVETVKSVEAAEKLNTASVKHIKNKFNIMLQVNTSGETQKSGFEPTAVTEIYKHIMNNCHNLQLLGLMTIGSNDSSLDQSETNKDFQVLKECRLEIAQKLDIDLNNIELSMGMSHDFEKAIEMGSTNVRIGSLIFGSREKK